MDRTELAWWEVFGFSTRFILRILLGGLLMLAVGVVYGVIIAILVYAGHSTAASAAAVLLCPVGVSLVDAIGHVSIHWAGPALEEGMERARLYGEAERRRNS